MADDFRIDDYWYGSDVLDCRHHEYVNQIKDWQEIRTALLGGLNWKKKALARYEGESKKSFNFRLKTAMNAMSVKTPIQALQNLARDSADQAILKNFSNRIQAVMDEDVDNNGQNWYTWMVGTPFETLAAYGQCYIVSSSPARISRITMAEEKDNNPFMFSLTPLDVLNWQYENGSTKENGQFSDILFLSHDVVINPNTRFYEYYDIAVRITREFYAIMAVNECSLPLGEHGEWLNFKRGDLIRAFPNELGLVPVRRADVGGSLVIDGVDASRQAMNIQSASFKGTFDANFNQKVVIGISEDDDEITLGSEELLKLPENGDYKVVGNPANEVENSIRFNDDLQDRFDNSMQNSYHNLARKGREVPSGEALKEINAPQAQSVGTINDQLGDCLEDNAAWMHQLGGETPSPEMEVVLPTTYESNDQAERTKNAFEMQGIKAHSDEGLEIVLTHKWKNLASGKALEDVVKAEMENIKRIAQGDSDLLEMPDETLESTLG